MDEENNILGAFPNNPDVGAEIDRSMISQSSIPGYTERLLENQKLINQPEAIGPQGAGAYPGAGFNINVGSSSGSMIGSQPIFVPGGNVLAVDPILARRKAIDDAAKARAQSLQKMKTPESYKLQGEGVRLQEKLDNSFYSEIKKLQDQAVADYGNDAAVVLGDRNTDEGRRMFELANSYDQFGSNVDLVTSNIAKMDEALQNKDLIFSKEAMKLRDEYKNLAGEIFGGETFDPALLGRLAQVSTKLEGQMTLQRYLNNEVKWKDLEGRATGSFRVGDNGEYYKTTNNEKVSFAEVRKAIYEEALKDFDFAIQQGIYTPEEIKSSIDARLQDQQKQTGSVTKKNEADIDRSEISVSEVDTQKPRVSRITKYNEDGTVASSKPSEYNEYFYAAINGAKNVTLDSPQRINGNNMNDRVAGNVDFTPVGFAVIRNENGKDAKVVYGKAAVPVTVYTDKDNKVYSEEQYKNMPTSVLDPTTGRESNPKQGLKRKTIYEDQDMTVVWDETIQGKMKQSMPKQNIDAVYTQAEQAKMSSRNKSTTTSSGRYIYQGESWTAEELKGAGWTDEQISTLKKQ